MALFINVPLNNEQTSSKNISANVISKKNTF